MTAAEYGDVSFARTLSVAEITAERTPLYVVTVDGITHLRSLMDGRYAQAADLQELTDADIDDAWNAAMKESTN